jgi:hypothetical protein
VSSPRRASSAIPRSTLTTTLQVLFAARSNAAVKVVEEVDMASFSYDPTCTYSDEELQFLLGENLLKALFQQVEDTTMDDAHDGLESLVFFYDIFPYNDDDDIRAGGSPAAGHPEDVDDDGAGGARATPRCPSSDAVKVEEEVDVATIGNDSTFGYEELQFLLGRDLLEALER